MCVPLRARGRALGALTLLTRSDGRSYGADDLAAAQDLAGMAALAVDNARLTREVEEAADAARVLTYVADGVILIDRAGTIRLWNPAAEAITGLSADSVLGRPAAEAIGGWKALAERIPIGAATEQVQPETFPLETGLGERWISISGVDFFGGTVYAFRDLTDARRLEELKADFVATASHELRTPLAAVYGAAQTLRRHDFALDEAGRDRFVSLIVDESERLNRIVNEILLANQLDAGRLDLMEEPFDPGDLVERVVDAAREHRPPGIRLSIQVADEVPSVAADRDRVRQVLVNLVENAIKYSPDGGLVEVGVEETEGTVCFHVKRRGPRHPRRRAGADLREVLPPRPGDDARDRRHRPRPLHLQRAPRAHGRPDLGGVQGGGGLDLLLRAPGGRSGRRSPPPRRRHARELGRLAALRARKVDDHPVGVAQLERIPAGLTLEPEHPAERGLEVAAAHRLAEHVEAGPQHRRAVVRGLVLEVDAGRPVEDEVDERVAAHGQRLAAVVIWKNGGRAARIS